MEIKCGLKLPGGSLNAKRIPGDAFDGELSENGNVCGDAVPVVAKAIAKVGGKQVVINSNANFRACEQDHDGECDQPPRGDQDAGTEKGAQHRRVNGVADHPIGAGNDEFVIGVDPGFNAPLLSQSAPRRPGEQSGKIE